MLDEIGKGVIAVVTTGRGPVTVVDDVITDTRHTVPSGSALVLPRNGPEEWEPTPLPGPPPPGPEATAVAAKEDDEWEPTRLPRTPRPVRTLDLPLAAGSAGIASDLAAQGGSLRLRLAVTDELRLSQLSGIPEAIHEGDGSLIVELFDDG